MLYIIRFFEPGSLPHFAKHEEAITSNIQEKIGRCEITRDRGRLFVETEDPDAAELLKEMRGISSFSGAVKCDIKDLADVAAKIAKDALKDSKTFAVKVRRSGEHVESSREIAGYLGGRILNELPHLKVNLEGAEKEIFVEIKGNDCFVFTEIIRPSIPLKSPIEEKEPRFIADDMVGKLAKRLRVLGYDTVYISGAPDTEYFRIAKEEGRILLTRDRLLSLETGIRTLLIDSTDIEEQLNQVVRDLRLAPDPKKMFLRCSVCNVLIDPIQKEQVKDKVPERVFKEYDEFHRCPNCKRVYWKGSHYENLKKEFEKLQ